jgi:tetratricopeptide (TPR) repeat protein
MIGKLKRNKKEYQNKKRVNRTFYLICLIFLLNSSSFAQKAEILKKCEAYYKLENYDSLIVNCNRYLQLDTLNPRVYLLRGHAFNAKENSDQLSLADFEKCLKLDPLNAEAFYWCKVLKEEEWFLEDWEYYEVIKLDSNYYLPYFGLARKKIFLYWKGGEELELLDSVDILLNRAIELKPNEYDIILERAEYYLRIKEYKLAQKDFNKAITLDARKIDAYKGRGEVLFFLNQFTLAISDLTKYINYETDRFMKIVGHTDFIDPDVFVLRGNCYAKLGNRTMALVDYNRVGEYLVRDKRIQWIYNFNKCIDQWSLILENRSELIINQITFNLIISNEEDEVLFKKQYTLDIKLSPGDIAPIASFPVGGELCYSQREMEFLNFDFDLEKIK